MISSKRVLAKKKRYKTFGNNSPTSSNFPSISQFCPDKLALVTESSSCFFAVFSLECLGCYALYFNEVMEHISSPLWELVL